MDYARFTERAGSLEERARMDTATAGPVVVPKQSEIGALLGAMDSLLQRLDDEIQTLAGRLEPVRAPQPQPGRPPTSEPLPVNSRLGEVLHGMNKRIDSAIDRLKDVRAELVL